MSKLNGNLFRGKPLASALLFYGPRIAACILLLICSLLTASCGFITQSEAGPSKAEKLTLRRREDLSEEAWTSRNDNIQPFSFWRTTTRGR